MTIERQTIVFTLISAYLANGGRRNAVSNRAALVLAVALILCALIYAAATRYEIAGSSPVAYKLDRWTGQVWLIVQGQERTIRR
jgi:hypothetical protein